MILKMLKIIYITSIITSITAIITKSFVFTASVTVITFWNYNFHYCYYYCSVLFFVNVYTIHTKSYPETSSMRKLWSQVWSVWNIFGIEKKTKKLLWQYLLQGMCSAHRCYFLKFHYRQSSRYLWNIIRGSLSSRLE